MAVFTPSGRTSRPSVKTRQTLFRLDGQVVQKPTYIHSWRINGRTLVSGYQYSQRGVGQPKEMLVGGKSNGGHKKARGKRVEKAKQ